MEISKAFDISKNKKKILVAPNFDGLKNRFFF